MSYILFIFVPVLALFICFSLPILIGRIASLAGRYRVVVMVILLLLLWSIGLPAVGYFVLFRGDAPISAVVAVNMGMSIVLVVPLILGGRVLARLIALRYAPTVADAIASVIVGSTASFVTPLLSIYLTFSFLTSFFKNSLINISDAKPLPPLLVISMMGVMILVTASSAWILMGWGSMPILRRRKGTVLGLVCVGLAVVFSIITTLVAAYMGGLLYNSFGTGAEIILFFGALMAVGAISIIVGMLSAGFMHGILVGLASIFDFVAFLMMLFFMALSFAINSTSVTDTTPLKMLTLIVALSVVQLRAILIGHRVISMLGILLLAIPFFAFYIQIPYFNLAAAALPLFLLFILLVVLLGRWGIALRRMRYGGYISIALLAATFLALPAIFLIP